MGIGRQMRRLCGELVAELSLGAPARPHDLYTALCDAMSRRRGRPVQFRTAVFPACTASGLWLDMADQDLVVIEERTAPDHQLVDRKSTRLNSSHNQRSRMPSSA